MIMQYRASLVNLKETSALDLTVSQRLKMKENNILQLQ